MHPRIKDRGANSKLNQHENVMIMMTCFAILLHSSATRVNSKRRRRMLFLLTPWDILRMLEISWNEVSLQESEQTSNGSQAYLWLQALLSNSSLCLSKHHLGVMDRFTQRMTSPSMVCCNNSLGAKSDSRGSTETIRLWSTSPGIPNALMAALQPHSNPISMILLGNFEYQFRDCILKVNKLI